jgi:hypothetical protein
MTKGRAAPPKNPTIEEMIAKMNQPGLYILEYKHNDGCKTILTQRWEDCTCAADDVDHYLLSYDELEGGAK